MNEERAAKILVVDDDRNLRRVLSEILLLQKYTVIEAENGVQAIEKVASDSPDVILLDMNMPGMNGMDVIRHLKSEKASKMIPIIVVTGETDIQHRIEALKMGADDFLVKPPHIAELTARVGSLVKVKAYSDYMQKYQTILEEEVRSRTKELVRVNEKLKAASLDTIYRLSRAAEYKDEDTSVHLQRMSHYAAAIARESGMGEEESEAILYASPMHDIGKLGIPDRILLKPGKLNSDEWDIMKQHTVFGGRILEGSESDFIMLGKTIAVSHHEMWDGTGYPRGLKGEDIPVSGRICAVADVFDALTSRRPYKEPFSAENAFQIIKEGKGNRFDPGLVDVFLGIRKKILGIMETYRDTGNSIFLELASDSGEECVDSTAV